MALNEVGDRLGVELAAALVESQRGRFLLATVVGQGQSSSTALPGAGSSADGSVL